MSNYEIDPSGFRSDNGIAYGESLRFPTENEKYVNNIGIGALCILSTQIIPVLGQLIYMGYMFDIIESLHKNPKQSSYPDFATDKFADYMLRGLWLFLVALISMVAIVPVFIILFIIGAVCTGGLASALGEEAGGVAAVLMIGIFAAVGFVAYIAFAFILTPFMIRAGLSQDLMASFDFGFAKDFIAKTWKEMLVAGIFFLAVMIVAELIGLLLCIIGVFPAVAWAMLVQTHLLWQLYELYLARGGTPIPLKPETLPKPPIAPQA